MSYDRQQKATATAKATANGTSLQLSRRRNALHAHHLMRSILRRGSTRPHMSPSTNNIEETTYDPLGTWSGDENIDIREEDDDVDVCEKVKDLSNQEFPGKFRS